MNFINTSVVVIIHIEMSLSGYAHTGGSAVLERIKNDIVTQSNN